MQQYTQRNSLLHLCEIATSVQKLRLQDCARFPVTGNRFAPGFHTRSCCCGNVPLERSKLSTRSTLYCDKWSMIHVYSNMCGSVLVSLLKSFTCPFAFGKLCGFRSDEGQCTSASPSALDFCMLAQTRARCIDFGHLLCAGKGSTRFWNGVCNKKSPESICMQM